MSPLDDNTSLFGSGPALRAPTGDPERQAVAALRGYAYQLAASALAWVNLSEDEELYLEVAEDYAVVAQEALEAVQVGPMVSRSFRALWVA